MSEIITRYNKEYGALQAEIAAAQKKAKAMVKDVLPAAAKEFFERNPEAYGFGWVQYAPYFNDGDACEFSAHEPHVWLSEESLDDNGFHFGDDHTFDECSQIAEDFAAIKAVIGGIDDDYLEQLYGDGKAILFTKDGIKVREYSHD
ncbi:hypothetical protein G6L37_06560 [Agrobacterium rubi]|nr:hypothetical protein [Agrobacterium rubi]NTF25025.1 hypothetical protein [Agrobacterium rubi]